MRNINNKYRNKRRYRRKIGIRKHTFPWKSILLIIVGLALAAGAVLGITKLFGKEDAEVQEPAETIQTMQQLFDSTESGQIPGFTKYGGDILLQDTQLLIEQFGGYTGPFVEHGADRPVSDRAAILLFNGSEQMIEKAEIRLLVSGKEVSFVFTKLPPRGKVLVFAEEAEMCLPTDKWVYVSETIVYEEAAPFSGDTLIVADKMQLKPQDGTIAVENLTEADIYDVHVYYKYCYEDTYIGGITYRCPFDTLAAGETKADVCKHYLQKYGRIVDVNFVG